MTKGNSNCKKKILKTESPSALPPNLPAFVGESLGKAGASRVIEYANDFLMESQRKVTASHPVVGYLEKNLHLPGSRKVIKC